MSHYDDVEDCWVQSDEDVESLYARIAAAAIRQGYGFIEDLIQEAKDKWIEEGRKAERDAIARKNDADMVWHRKRRYWFQTLDGLLGEHQIDAEVNREEEIRLAVRHPMELAISAETHFEASIPIRRYRWLGRRHRDGRPIFEEQA